MDKSIKRLVEITNEGLCDSCLGRLFGAGGKELSNSQRGSSIKTTVVLLLEEELEKGVRGENKKRILEALSHLKKSHYYRNEVACRLCGGLMNKIDDLVKLVTKSSKGLEFSTFQIGTKVSGELIVREEELIRKYDLRAAEPINREINREVGKRFMERVKAEFNREKPDVVFIIDTEFFSVQRLISPLFIYGRYRKLKRGIPQTHWPHKACGGRGCPECNFTGKQYPTSVEEIIGERLKENTHATHYALHGMGREDVDALMLGRGRPFIMELTSPLRRKVDFEKVEEEIKRKSEGMVEVEGLRYSTKREVIKIKASRAKKTYRVKIQSQDGILSPEKLKKALSLLSSSPINQRTPKRVAHRRADKIRTRHVYDAQIDELKDDKATLIIKGEAGLYVKELIHGDEGRTNPSIASILGIPLMVVELDVLDISEEYDKEE